MILTKEIKVELTKFNYHHYKRMGYDTDNKEFIMVRIEDIGLKSVIKIDTECDICGNIKSITYVKYNKNISSGGFYACSNRCAIVKGEKTCLKKYGTKYALQNEDIKQKTKEYFMEKFGFDNPSKSKEVSNKRENTMIERFGVKTNLILPETHKKAIDKSRSDESKNKRNNTLLERYGFDNCMKSKDVYDRFKKTNIIKYGFEYPAQNIDIFSKTQISQLKMKYFEDIRYQGTYELDFLEYCNKLNIIDKISKVKTIKYKLDGVDRCYHPDFFINELNLIIEIKSSYYYNLYLEKNLVKEKYTLESGFNFIFIIDKNYDDFLERIKTII
jgi:hypothetical protein